MANHEGPIRILDEIVVKPGCITAYRDAVFAEYVPLARQRGMTLVFSDRSPPVDIAGEPVTLLFLWSITDVRAWWAMRVRDTDAKADWWAGAQAMTVTRRRLLLTDFSPADANR